MFAKKRNKMNSIHKTVLLNETIDGLLAPKKAGNGKNLVVLDATFGGGGHSRLLCEKYPGIKIIALDQDQETLNNARDKFSDCNIVFSNTNFRNLDIVLAEKGIETVDGIIMDLGLSSDQLENSGRGFSFLKNEPLLMTMKANPTSQDLTAREIVNNWAEENIATIIYGYGEERFSKKIAKKIVEARHHQKIETTFDLVKIIGQAVPGAYRRGRIHCATKTFQALRIAVNDELVALSEALKKGFNVLKIDGRMVVISFHSLEDRIVKRFYKNKEKEGEAKLINKKIITASAEEIKENPRARSAKLRILEKVIA